MPRQQTLWMLVLLSGSGCSVFAPSDAVVSAATDRSSPDTANFHQSRSGFIAAVDSNAKPLALTDLRPGQSVELRTIERMADSGESGETVGEVRWFIGLVTSVDSGQIVLNDAVQITEARRETATPFLSSIPVLRRRFSNSATAWESRRLPHGVTIPVTEIASVKELSPTGVETVQRLGSEERLGVDFEKD